MIQMKVYVFVAVWRGLEGETRVFRRKEDADKYYEGFAKKLGVAYDKDMQDYDWSGSDYSAWWSKCEVEGTMKKNLPEALATPKIKK